MAVSIHLTHLTFLSPRLPAVQVEFGPGLNLIYGPSNTGKSSIMDAIDFMLGRSRQLKEIPEHDEYEKILLGISSSEGASFTLQRSISGGDLSYYEGIHHQPPDIEATPLRLNKPTKKIESVPNFLLGLIGLAGKKLRKNSNNETVSLTVRNFVSLFLINEAEIQKEASPYITTQRTDQTVERSRLRLMLTGVDDNALIADEKEALTVSRQARLNLLSELISEQEDAIAELSADETVDKQEFEEQIAKLDSALSRQNEALTSSEADYRAQILQRNETRHDIDQSESRLAEVREMQARFLLLRDQYESDTQRLNNLIEAGTLFVAFPFAQCPVCGAETPEGHKHEACDGDAETVVAAAGVEKDKIASLAAELNDVLKKLASEEQYLQASLPGAQERLEGINQAIDRIAPVLTQNQSRYSEILAKKSSVERSLVLFDDLERLEKKKEDLEKEAPDGRNGQEDSSRLPTKALHNLSQVVSRLLTDWGLPGAETVHFDKQTDDFVIGGKNRVSNGKGHRALTHAAATLALMEYAEKRDLPHPGFVVLDSPLLTYEKPEFDEENLAQLDINLRFFRQLQSWTTRQIIILENKKSVPTEFEDGAQTTHFTKSNESGRYGFFPTEAN